jgi:chromosome partitioning protein
MPKIILITHQKGGVGKSTLTFNLAQNICQNAKVAIIDIDAQGSISQLKGMNHDFDIINIVKNLEEISSLEYDFVLIDTPPYLSDLLPNLIQMADLILIPTKAGVLDLLAIGNTIDLIKTQRKEKDTLIIFNMIKPNTTLTLDILIGVEEYAISVAKTHISDLVAFTRSILLKGVSNNAKAQKQLDNLTKGVLTKLI